MPIQTFLAEFKRRKVFRVVIVYAVVGWLVIQIANTVFPHLNLPEWSTRFVVMIVLLGFPIALVLAWAFELTPDGVRLTSHTDRKKKRVAPAAHWGWKRHALAYFTVAALGSVIAIMVFRWWQPNDIAITNAQPVIAVLPFDNLSAEAEHAAFADAVHDSVLTQLAKNPRLAVISRASVLQYQNRATRPTMAAIAQDLHAKFVLEGSVFRHDQRVKISAQLIDAQTDRHIWADTFEQPLDDLFSVQNQIAEQISRALNVALTPSEQQQVAALPTTDSVAYEHFILGRAARNQTDFDNAIKHLKQAVALDPDFALAWCQLTMALVQGHWNEGRDPDLVETKAALATAKQLQANEADLVVATAAYYYMGEQNYTEAEKYFRRALVLNPNDAASYEFLGYVRRRRGDLPEARRLIEQALALNPQVPFLQLVQCDTYHALQEKQFAMSCYKNILQRETNSGFIVTNANLRLNLFYLHDLTRFRLQAERDVIRFPSSSDALQQLAWARWLTGDTHSFANYVEAVIEKMPASEFLTSRSLLRGQALLKAHRLNEAKQQFTQCVEDSSLAISRTTPIDQADAAMYGAICRAVLHDHQGAKQWLDLAAQRFTEAGDLLSLALLNRFSTLVLARAGDYKKTTDAAARSLQAPSAHFAEEFWYDPNLPKELRRYPAFLVLMRQHGIDTNQLPSHEYELKDLML